MSVVYNYYYRRATAIPLFVIDESGAVLERADKASLAWQLAKRSHTWIRSFEPKASRFPSWSTHHITNVMDTSRQEKGIRFLQDNTPNFTSCQSLYLCMGQHRNKNWPLSDEKLAIPDRSHSLFASNWDYLFHGCMYKTYHKKHIRHIFLSFLRYKLRKHTFDFLILLVRP